MNTSEVFDEVVKGKGRVVDPHAQEWERTYAMFSHLSLLATHFGLIIPLPGLIMWLIKRDSTPFVEDHAKEAFNFQLSLCIYAVASAILTLCGIGVLLLIGVYILAIVGMILAATAAHKGQFYRYPMTIRFF